MNTDDLLKEIDSVFPSFDMPSHSELALVSPRYIEADEICNSMEEFRGKSIETEAIRTIHSYLPILSSKGMRWILPWYLRFCLTDEGQKYSRKETWSLIDTLHPDERFLKYRLGQLSLLNRDQLLCLIHFLEWCLLDEFWFDSEPEHIQAGIEFLKLAMAPNAS